MIIPKHAAGLSNRHTITSGGNMITVYIAIFMIILSSIACIVYYIQDGSRGFLVIALAFTNVAIILLAVAILVLVAMITAGQ
jgi:hypothetical protein